MSKVLTPILFTIIAIGLFFSYLKPAFSELQASKERQQKLEQVIKESEELLQKYEMLKTKKYAISGQNSKNLYKILPDTIDSVRLILDLDSLATKYGLTILSFKVPEINNDSAKTNNKKTTAETESPVKSAVLTIECESEYADFKTFLSDIERSMSLMDVVELTVTVPEIEEDTVSGEAVYTLGLQTYWLKEM